MTNNILLCYYTIGGTSYYQDLAEELINNGNHILHWNCYNPNYSKKNREEILEKIKTFNPNLIFSFNNIAPEEIISTFQVPTVILDADNPEFFSNKEIIKKYDFFYLGYQSNSKELYQKILDLKLTDKNYLYFPTATNFRKDPNIAQTINISFIGSNFYRNFLEDRILNEQEIDTMLHLTKEIRKNYYFQDDAIDPSLINFTKYYLSGQERLKYLSALSDLGLQIYSNSNWKELFVYDLELANCYNKNVLITKDENQLLYNSSKICINLSHLQATNSFSWRVPDIMASNACLLMENKTDWHTVFGLYISDFVKKAIIYKDQYDLREKCIKILNDEDLRQRCTQECQDAIEKNGRWAHRIKDLESFLNLKLLNNYYNLEVKNHKIIVNPEPENKHNSDTTQILENDENSDHHQILENDENSDHHQILENDENSDHHQILDEDYIKPKKLDTPKKPKSSFAIWIQCFVILIYFTPIIGKILIKSSKANKTIRKINAYINRQKIVSPNKSSFSIWIKCFVVLIYFIPIIGKILIKKKKVTKIISKINTHINRQKIVNINI